MPTLVVKWFLRKFELHSKLVPSHVSIKKDGKILEGEEKKKFITDFNEATLLKNTMYIQVTNTIFYILKTHLILLIIK